MSLDHESRPAVETTQNPNRSKRKRNTIIASVAGGTAVALAVGLGVGLNGNSKEADHPNAGTRTSATPTPGEASPTPSAPETQAGSEPVALSSEATPFGRSSELSSQADQDNFVAKFYSAMDPEGLRSLSTNGELDRLEYNDANLAAFITKSQLSNRGIDGVYGLNDAVADVSDTLSQPMNFSNPDQAQQWFGDKLNPANNLTAADFKAAVAKKDAKSLYERLTNLEDSNYVKAQSLYLDDLIAVAKQGHIDPNSDKLVNHLFNLQDQYSRLATLGETGDMAARTGDSFKQWASDSINNLLGKQPVEKLTAAKDQVDQVIANPGIKINSVKIIDNIDAVNVTNGSGNVSLNSYAGDIVEIPFEVNYTDETDNLDITTIDVIAVLPDPVQGADQDQAMIGLRLDNYTLNQSQ